MMALIFLASNTPGGDLPTFGAFKLFALKGGHLVGYALLGLAYLHALVPRGPAPPRMARWAVLLASLYALSDETHQVFVLDRGAGVTDVLIDTLGATLGVGSRLLYQRRRRTDVDSAPLA